MHPSLSLPWPVLPLGLLFPWCSFWLHYFYCIGPCLLVHFLLDCRPPSESPCVLEPVGLPISVNCPLREYCKTVLLWRLAGLELVSERTGMCHHRGPTNCVPSCFLVCGAGLSAVCLPQRQEVLPFYFTYPANPSNPRSLGCLPVPHNLAQPMGKVWHMVFW